MNRIINKYFGIGLSMLSLLHSVSCSNEMEITGGEDAPSANVEFVPLSLTIPVTDVPSTKSWGWPEQDLLQGENRIESLYIELFLKRYGDYGDIRPEEKIASYDFYRNYPGPPQFSSDPFGIKALIPCPVEAYKLAPLREGKAKGYVRVSANYDRDPWLRIEDEDMLWNYDGTLKPLFMSAEGEIEYSPNGEYKYWSMVYLPHRLAKIRVKLGVSEDAVPDKTKLEIDYDHVKVQIVNAANFSDPWESKDVSSNAGFEYINYSERTGSTLRMKKEEGIYKAGEVIDSCYIHENIRDSYDENTTTSVLITIPSTDLTTGFKETHSQLIKIAGDDGYRLKRNHVYTLDLRLRSQKGIDIVQNISDWSDERLNTEVVDTSYLYTSGPLLLSPSMDTGYISFESSHSVQIDLSKITSGINIYTETVYKNEGSKAGHIQFKLKETPADPFSFYVTIASRKLQRKIKVTYNPS